MRKIERTNQFKKDYKRESKSHHRITLPHDFEKIISILANDKIPNPHYRDHALSGNWKNYRDCHIKPDLILIYRKPDAEILELVRLGSHSELSL